MNRGWKEYGLFELCNLLDTQRRPISKMERDKMQGSYPYYGASGIVDYINDYIYSEDTILISEDGENLNTRNTPIAFRARGKYWVNNHAHVLRPQKDYFFPIIINYIEQMDLSSFITGAVQPKLSQENLSKIKIFLPILENEQRAIAGVLSGLDDKIDLLHRQNKTLEGMAETLWRKMFLEGVDAGWAVGKLGDIAIVQNGFAFKSSEYVSFIDGYLEVLKMGHIQPGGGLRTAPKTDFVPREDRLTKYILLKGDIVMAMTDMKDNVVILGNPAMIDIGDKYVLNQRVARIYLKSNDKLMDSRLLYVQLKDPEFISILQSKANSGVQVNLSTESIKDCDILIPPIDVQIEKGATIIKAYLKKENNDYQIRTLSHMRGTLLPKLMSGEVRVQL